MSADLPPPRILSRRRSVASTCKMSLSGAGRCGRNRHEVADAGVNSAVLEHSGSRIAPRHSSSARTCSSCSMPGRLGLSQAMIPARHGVENSAIELGQRLLRSDLDEHRVALAGQAARPGPCSGPASSAVRPGLQRISAGSAT